MGNARFLGLAFLLGALLAGLGVWRYDHRPDPRIPAFHKSLDSLKGVVRQLDSSRVVLQDSIALGHQRATALQATATSTIRRLSARLAALDTLTPEVLAVTPGVDSTGFREMARQLSVAAAQLDSAHTADSLALSQALRRAVASETALHTAMAQLSQANAILAHPPKGRLCGLGGAAIYGLKGLDAGIGLTCRLPF